MQPIYIIVIAVFVLVVTLAAILRRYKRCPSDKILVIYGKTGKNKTGDADILFATKRKYYSFS